MHQRIPHIISLFLWNYKKVSCIKWGNSIILSQIIKTKIHAICFRQLPNCAKAYQPNLFRNCIHVDSFNRRLLQILDFLAILTILTNSDAQKPSVNNKTDLNFRFEATFKRTLLSKSSLGC